MNWDRGIFPMMVVLILHCSAFAQDQWYFTIHENSTKEISHARIVADSTGDTGFFIVDELKYSSSDHDVYGTLVAPGGSAPTVYPTVTINSSGTNTPAPAVAFDGEYYLVIWEQNDSGNWNIWGQFLDDDAAVLGTPFAISQATGVDFGAAVVANHGSNRFVVAYGIGPTDGNWELQHPNLFTRKIDFNGVTPVVGGQVLIAYDAAYPDLAEFTSTQVLLVYAKIAEATGPDSSTWNWDIYGRLVHDNGSADGSEQPISAASAGDFYPCVATNWSDDTALVAWHRKSSGIDYDIRYRGIFVEDDTGVISAVTDVNYVYDSGASDYEMSPQVARYDSADGSYIVVWQHEYQTSQYKIRAREISADFTATDTMFDVQPIVGNDQRNPDVSAVGSRALIAWQEYRSGNYGVRGRIYDRHLYLTLPAVQFEQASLSRPESAGQVCIPVTLSAASSQEVSVGVTVTGGTATRDTDYTFNGSQRAAWPAGNTSSKCLYINVTDDSLDEPNETVTLLLSSPSNAILGSPSGHTFTIQDNDVPTVPTVQFAQASSSSSESIASGYMLVTLSAASVNTVTVNYARTGGTATPGTDFSLSSPPLTFSPGDIQEPIYIYVENDSLDEFNETVTITLSSPTNATLGSPNPHTHTIEDDDPEPQVRFNTSGSAGSESTTSPFVYVSLSAVSGKTVTVDYARTGGTATPGTDFTLDAGTLLFDPGDLQKGIPFNVKNDGADEPDETVVITLSNASNAKLVSPNAHTYTIQDDDPPTSLTSAWVDFAYTGAETGSQSQPFNTLNEAINAVASGGTINIKGNTADTSTSEKPTISKSVTITAVGGTVTIGGTGKIQADETWSLETLLKNFAPPAAEGEGEGEGETEDQNVEDIEGGG